MRAGFRTIEGMYVAIKTNKQSNIYGNNSWKVHGIHA